MSYADNRHCAKGVSFLKQSRNGREIVASCTPRNAETAARQLARDLRLALNS